MGKAEGEYGIKPQWEKQSELFEILTVYSLDGICTETKWLNLYFVSDQIH